MPFKKGQSGNPKGRPKDGESWAGIFREIGDLTPAGAGELGTEIGKRLSQNYGKTELNLRKLLALRLYDAALFDPQPGIVNIIIEREDGKVKDVVETSGKLEIVIGATQWTPG